MYSLFGSFFGIDEPLCGFLRLWGVELDGIRWWIDCVQRDAGLFFAKHQKAVRGATALRPADGWIRRCLRVGEFQVSSSRLPPNAGFLLDAPQRPAQPAERDHLLSFLFAQDIAHLDGE